MKKIELEKVLNIYIYKISSYNFPQKLDDLYISVGYFINYFNFLFKILKSVLFFSSI